MRFKRSAFVKFSGVFALLFLFTSTAQASWLSDATDWVGDRVDNAADVVDAGTDWVGGAVDTATDWTTGAAETAWDWTAGATETAWDWTTGATETAWDWTAGAAETAWDWTLETSPLVLAEATDVIYGIRDEVAGIINFIGSPTGSDTVGDDLFDWAEQLAIVIVAEPVLTATLPVIYVADLIGDELTAVGAGNVVPDFIGDMRDRADIFIGTGVEDIFDGDGIDATSWGTAAWGRPHIDCAVREDLRTDRGMDNGCQVASSFVGDCVPHSALTTQNACLELDASAVLCDCTDELCANLDPATRQPSPPFNVQVFLTTDNVDFDCNGQTIDHQNKGAFRSGVAATVVKSVHSISVHDCTIKNTKGYGVSLKRYFRADEPGLSSPGKAELVGPMPGHSGINVTNVKVFNAASTAIYVGQNSENTSLINIDVSNSYGGVYLEAGSTGTTIENSSFVGSTDREDISVDSSEGNIIQGCYFEDNAVGDAINLYKNCGEITGQVCPVVRTMDASHNVISDNDFVGGSVNVAWRMGKLYPPGHCETLRLGGAWSDVAENNTVVDNRFSQGAQMTIDEDLNSTSGNTFN